MTHHRPAFPSRRISLAFLLLAALEPGSATAEPHAPELVATYRGLGGQFASAVAPGREPGSQRVYAAYLYNDDTFEVTSIDPATGAFEVLPNPVPGEFGTRTMVAGPDGNAYLGSLPRAHLIKVDTRTGKLVDLGRPAPSEEFIWDLTFGPDEKLYGGTSPTARLVRYDPKTGKLEDLGRMDPTEQYVRHVAASADGFVYGAVGTTRMNLAAFQIATGEHREVLPKEQQVAGVPEVWAAPDGKVYALAGKQSYRLDGFTAVPIAASAAGQRPAPQRLKDGRLASVAPGELRLQGKDRKMESRPYRYAGRELAVFRLGLGPDGKVYGSTMLPARLLRLDEEQRKLDVVADLGGGEVYAFLSLGKHLLMAAYGVGAPLLTYNPAQPVQTVTPANPAPVHYAGSDESWRPLAMATGPDGKAWIGAIPGYGKSGGPLVAWDPERGPPEPNEAVIPGHSITALAPWKDKLVGGTSVKGGSGAKVTATTAKVFVWDPATRKVSFDMEPVRNAPGIENVVAVGGVVWGTAGNTLFAVDLERRQVKLSKPLPFPGGTAYGALVPGPDGRLWGFGGHPRAGIFSVDPASGEAVLEVKMPRPISAGIAVKGRHVYFACGAEVYRWALPGKRASRD